MNQLMLFRETIAVYCGTKRNAKNTICGQNAGIVL
jgi:hypothetical protein